jgi:hypothetical protein
MGTDEHYRRGDPETGCAWLMGVVVVFAILGVMFFLGAIVPAVVRWML